MAQATNEVVSTVNWMATGSPGVMNCGNRAEKNRMALGLVSATVKPWRKSFQNEFGFAAPCTTGALGTMLALMRHCLMPRYTRYRAPASFSSMKAVAEVASTTPMPAMAMPEIMNSPVPLPMLLIMARRGPTAMEFEMASRTAGPGEKVTSRETLQNSSQFEICMVFPEGQWRQEHSPAL